VSRDERALQAGLNDPAIPPALAHGELTILGLMPNSSNYTFLAKAETSVDSVLAIYKPRRGEIPLWDFPEGTLAQREVAAYVVARALGWPNVPPTILRDGPEGIGSVQLFVAFDPEEHYFTLQETHADTFRDVALFDAVINNADRKGGHCLLSEDGSIFLIDHGVCFNEEDKLRTVIWDHAGEPIGPGRRDDLERLAGDLADPHDPVRSDLDALLDLEEVRALQRRLATLIAAGVFPQPGLDRPFPWPPV
jgi:uncharacterized repeat protein (TIGR03843 family)